MDFQIIKKKKIHLPCLKNRKQMRQVKHCHSYFYLDDHLRVIEKHCPTEGHIQRGVSGLQGYMGDWVYGGTPYPERGS